MDLSHNMDYSNINDDPQYTFSHNNDYGDEDEADEDDDEEEV